MGKFDKDRFQKELAIRYCLVKKIVPFLEVIVPNIADLSESVEVLTDIDVLGVELTGGGGLRRVIFDCKTGNKMSAINRAFWAAGVKQYANCNEAYVILKSKAVHSHRISALAIDVDLHDEGSFRDLGRTADPAFPADDCYQSSIDRWNVIYDFYTKNGWTEPLYDLARNIVPLTQAPWSAFRRILAELRNVRGQFDPAKDGHVAIFLDVLASTFVLWATLGRDIRRFYEPTMSKLEFEKILRYYIWGGKESYNIRQQMRDKTSSSIGNVELPFWDLLVSFAGLIVSAPQSIFDCAHVCRELSIRMVVDPNDVFDKKISEHFKDNSRIRQFSISLSNYLVEAGGLPHDLQKRAEAILFKI